MISGLDEDQDAVFHREDDTGVRGGRVQGFTKNRLGVDLIFTIESTTYRHAIAGM